MNAQNTIPLSPLSPTEAFVRPIVDEEGYRAVGPLAIAAALFTLLSPFICFDPLLGLIPCLGIYLSIRAIGRIKAEPDHFTGLGIARFALAFSVALLVGGLGAHAYIYNTEVPEGFDRITFENLSPDPSVVGQAYPPKIEQLNGKKVFIKGYMKPGFASSQIRDFLLVRDMGECCFGTTNPIITDRIKIHLTNPEGIDYGLGVKAWGVFRFDPKRQPGVYYYLDDAEAR